MRASASFLSPRRRPPLGSDRRRLRAPTSVDVVGWRPDPANGDQAAILGGPRNAASRPLKRFTMLEPCPECENSVSDSAETCPHCGYRLLGRENLVYCP